jgi:hypothetical protein
MRAATPIDTSQSSAAFPTIQNPPNPVPRPRSYDKPPREYAARQPDWHKFYLGLSDRQGALHKKSGADNRWQAFLREEKLLLISWALLAIYLGFSYLHSAEQAKWLRDEMSNVQQTLSEKIDTASVQLNRCLDLTEKNSLDLDRQKGRLQTDETDWEQQLELQKSTLQRIKSDVENANRELREQSLRINLLQDKNTRHSAQIEQMREIQSMQVGAENSAPGEASPKNQADSRSTATNPPVASDHPAASGSSSK